MQFSLPSMIPAPRRAQRWFLAPAVIFVVLALVGLKIMKVPFCPMKKKKPPPVLKAFHLPREFTAGLTLETLTREIPSVKSAVGPEELESSISLCKSLVESSLADGGQIEVLTYIRGLLTGLTKAVLVRNVPKDPYVPPTPTDGSRSLKMAKSVSECMMVGLVQVVAELVSYDKWEKQYDNGLIHTGFPLEKGGAAISKPGSLPWHMDMSYLPIHLIPDILALTNLREGHDKDIITTLMDNADVLAKIDPIFQKVLREPRFVLSKPKWVSDWEPKPQPLVFGPDDSPTITAPTSGAAAISAASPQDEIANAAVKALYEAIQKVEDEGLTTAVHLKPGDVLLFNNKKVLHSRRSFSEACFDGEDRIIQRIYALFSLEGIIVTNRDIGDDA